MSDEVEVHDHSVELHNLLEAGSAVFAELEGQAAHERLQVELANFKKALSSAAAAIAPVRDEVKAIVEAVEGQRAQAAADAAQQRHDDHNAKLDNKSPDGPEAADSSSPKPVNPAPAGGTIQ